MVATLHHRGPDDATTFVDGPLGFAHARLSIIDLAGGQQPVHNEDRSVWTIFNGEIFNYLELRRDLEAKGHTFYTHSDTEVIVHAYEEHGLDFVNQLNGQWAIALWDVKRKRLVLTRDRAGERPIFFTEAGGRLLFASEVKALLPVLASRPRLDPRGLAQKLVFWAPQAPQSLFAGIESLPPGHTMVVEDGRRSLRKYWDWSFPSDPGGARRFEDYADELRALLIDAVK